MSGVCWGWLAVYSAPRRAGVAPRTSAGQAVPDRPLHGVHVALARCSHPVRRSGGTQGARRATFDRRSDGFVALILRTAFLHRYPPTLADTVSPSRHAGPGLRCATGRPTPCTCFLEGLAVSVK